MTEPRIVERDDPEDVFALVSDDTRVEILRTLWAADQPLTFSELHGAVEIVDSGQFNYHLDKLVGRFVRKTADGYELTQAGKGINGAIEAGAFTLEATIDPIELADPCPACGGTRTLTYEDEVVQIECESCEVTYQFVVPPGAFAGAHRSSIPQVANRYLRATFQKIKSGFCWFCDGHTQPTLETQPVPPETADADVSDDLPEVPVVHYNCQRCGHTATAGLWLATLDHPAVQRFYYEQGIDIRDRRIWDFPVFDLDHLDVKQQAPPWGSVTHRVGGETLTLVIDETAEVVEIAD